MHQYFKYVIRGHGSINRQGDFIKDLSRTQVSMYKACALRNEATGQRFDAKCGSNFWRVFLKYVNTSL